MGQDSEAAAEFVATVRGDHAKMKEWYNGHASAARLREQYGEYPPLWKEVLNWPGWKDARREYLKFVQQNESGNGNSNSNNNNNNNSNEGSIPRKRKSRWGTKSTPNNNNNNGGASSRFGPPEKRPAVVVPPPLNLPGMGGAAMTQNLTPQQQQELQRLQTQLRRVNERLDNLEKEAARVDALPRDDPERSPSPPPSK